MPVDIIYFTSSTSGPINLLQACISRIYPAGKLSGQARWLVCTSIQGHMGRALDNDALFQKTKPISNCTKLHFHSSKGGNNVPYRPNLVGFVSLGFHVALTRACRNNIISHLYNHRLTCNRKYSSIPGIVFKSF